MCSFSGRTTAWQRSPDASPSVGARTVVPWSSRTSPAAVHRRRHQVGDADEAGDEGGCGPLVDVLGDADLLDPAAVHHRDPVAHRQRLLLIVGDVDEGDPDLALDPLQLDLQPLAELQVERSERLVEQQHLGQVDQRPRQRHALLLAAGELRRAPLRLGGEPDPLQLGGDALADLAPSAPACA